MSYFKRPSEGDKVYRKPEGNGVITDIDYDTEEATVAFQDNVWEAIPFFVFEGTWTDRFNGMFYLPET